MDKKTNYKKSLVRNTEQTLRKCKINTVAEVPTTSKQDVQKPQDLEKQSASSSKPTSKLSHFDTPKLYSTLKFEKTIDNIIQPRKVKTSVDTAEKKLSVDEKLTRKVNFPYDQPIYKDLIPLTVKQTQSQPIVSSRNPMPQKDKEPVLLNFVEPKQVPDYYCLPNVKFESKGMIAASNNLRLYNMIKKDSQE